MSTSSRNTYLEIVEIFKSFPIFRSIRKGLKSSRHIQGLSSKIPAEELSYVLDELALFSLIGILYRLTPNEEEAVMSKPGDKSKVDSPARSPQDKLSLEASENAPVPDGPEEAS